MNKPSKPSKAPPTAKLQRSAISGMALAKAGVKHLGHKARQLTRDSEEQKEAQDEHEADLGRILFRALNQLKGTALKVSQMLAMEANFLPANVRQELAKACYQVTPLNRALVHKLFQQEFGKAPQEIFAEFEGIAFAAASLGQVHHARLHDGQAVAVKLQYPGIASSIASDMQMLRTLLQSFASRSSLMPDVSVIEHVMQEAERKLAEEVDYVHEAQQLLWFREHAQMLGIQIPRPILSHSTTSILCMTQLSGVHVDEWLASNPSQEQRDHAGQILFDWFIYSSFVLRRVHADPHPGNFLFMPDGQIGLLDFGCTKELHPTFCTKISALWCLLKQRDTPGNDAALLQAYLDLDVLRADLSVDDYRQNIAPAISEVQDWLIQPFMNDVFDFGSKSPYPQANKSHMQAVAKQIRKLDENIMYFDRNYLGIVHMLKRIGARVRTLNPHIC